MLLEEMIKDAQEQVNTLYRMLLREGRMEDLQKAIDDEEYREKLFEEYHID